MVVGRRQNWGNPPYPIAPPMHHGSLALDTPDCAVPIKFASHRGMPEGSAVIPIESLQSSANARFAYAVRSENDVDSRSLGFDFKRLADARKPMDEESFENHGGSPASIPDNILLKAAFPEPSSTSRKSSSDRGSVALCCSRKGLHTA